jgi:hypothetical protein
LVGSRRSFSHITPSALDFLMWVLEREMEGRKEREREKRRKKRKKKDV